MKLVGCILENFLGVVGQVTIRLADFNVLVGRNDVGKSTVLKALDLFLSDGSPSPDMRNRYSEGQTISITLLFDPKLKAVVIDEDVQTTFEEEELVGADGVLHFKKTWDVSKGKSKAESFVLRKRYGEHDFLLKPESDLLKLCGSLDIPTAKGGSADYNNVEKRRKLRDHLAQAGVSFAYEYEKLATSGTGRAKLIHDAIKSGLPRFEYFRADSSLEDTDAAIQSYFRQTVISAIEECDLSSVETKVRGRLDTLLTRLTGKINRTVPEEEQVVPHVEFDWSKVVKTTLRTKNATIDVPFSQRGDGFRRITMMSFFEHLAEESATQPIIFGFEEPETFLHPAAQEQLFETLAELPSAGHQVVICTHSPILVAQAPRAALTHVKKNGRDYTVSQNLTSYTEIADDLGITMKNQFVALFDKAKALLLVEGIDDATALTHTCRLYCEAGKVAATFEESQVAIIPTGGKDSIKHWVALDLLSQLSKPFVVFLDSDRECENGECETRDALVELGFIEGRDFLVTRKRSMENYIPCSALQRLVPEAAITYGDWDNVKDICKKWPDDRVRGILGGKRVLDKHFPSLSYDELEAGFSDGNGGDEFIQLQELVRSKLPSA